MIITPCSQPALQRTAVKLPARDRRTPALASGPRSATVELFISAPRRTSCPLRGAGVPCGRRARVAVRVASTTVAFFRCAYFSAGEKHPAAGFSHGASHAAVLTVSGGPPRTWRTTSRACGPPRRGQSNGRCQCDRLLGLPCVIRDPSTSLRRVLHDWPWDEAVVGGPLFAFQHRSACLSLCAKAYKCRGPGQNVGPVLGFAPSSSSLYPFLPSIHPDLL